MTTLNHKNIFGNTLKRCKFTALVFVFFSLMAAGEVFAQKLLIETPSGGPVARVFYGQVTLQGLTLFETRYLFEINAIKILKNPVSGNISEPSSPGSIESGVEDGSNPILASFFIPEKELEKCTRTARFRGFLALTSALKGKINSAVLKAGPGSEGCAENTREALGELLVGVEITLSSEDSNGVKIELGIVHRSLTKKSESLPGPAHEAPLKLPELLRGSRLTIDERPVRINSEGWFVAEVSEMSGTSLELSVPGRKVIALKANPVAITSDPYPVSGGFSYKARAAIFFRSELKIYISETPFLAQKTTLEGGGGGGLGYGREVPGEKRGQRLVSMIGIERREIYGDFGSRLTLLYTNASQTSVPQTYTARGLVYYDHRFFDDSVNMRVAVGMEIFRSKINMGKTRSSSTKARSVLIPSQVSTPTIGLAISKIFKSGIFFSPSIYVAPLYVSQVGFYPSLSPSLELGYKIRKDLAIAFNAGTETHRFPSIAGETKLQMDYALFSLKRGLY